MDNKVKVESGGIGFIGALQLIFIVLKLCGVINWSWFVVLIPLWIDLALVVIILILMGLIILKEVRNR